MLRTYIDDAKQIVEKIVFAARWLANASAGLGAGTLTTAIWMLAVFLPILVAEYVNPTLGAVSIPVAAVICYLDMLLDRRLTLILEEKHNVSVGRLASGRSSCSKTSRRKSGASSARSRSES